MPSLLVGPMITSCNPEEGLMNATASISTLEPFFPNLEPFFPSLEPFFPSLEPFFPSLEPTFFSSLGFVLFGAETGKEVRPKPQQLL